MKNMSDFTNKRICVSSDMFPILMARQNFIIFVLLRIAWAVCDNRVKREIEDEIDRVNEKTELLSKEIFAE